jgi:thymidylate synthase (FAD)
MTFIQKAYDKLREAGVPAEDARYILPNAATCNLTFTGNLRSILEFYGKRNPTTHAQWEIQELAEKIREEVIAVEPWSVNFFNK